MHTAFFRTRIAAPASEVYAWHTRHGAFQRLSPPWERLRLVRHEGVRDGQRTVFRVGAGPLWLKWVAEHRDAIEGEQFVDVQRKGPFRHWRHIHRFYPDAADAEASFAEDQVEYTLPFGSAAGLLTARRVRRRLERMFAYRHQVMQRDIAAHWRHARGRRLKIAVSGAEGLVGSVLVPFLTAGGHQVLRIVRTKPRHPNEEIFWDQHEMRIEPGRLEGVDAVIHLAAESALTMRWSDERRMQIYASRVRGAELLSNMLARLDAPPRVFICTADLSYYGSRGDETLTEASPPGQRGFLAAVAQDLESVTKAASDAGIRTVRIRLGTVLDPSAGLLGTVLSAFRLGLGGCYGSPDQYLSWITRDDAVHAIYHLLMTETLDGAFNVTAPQPVTLQAFAGTLGRVLSRPAVLNVPPLFFRLLYGEVAKETILLSTRAYPERLLAHGFRFEQPDLEQGLRLLLGRPAPAP